MAWQFWKTDRKLSSKEINEGASTRFLYTDEFPHDPKEALAKAEKLLKDAGYSIVEKPGLTRAGREFSTTLRKRIWVEEGWEALSVESRAEVLFHELVHVRQRHAWGHAKFLWRYKSAEGRWCIEVPAYRESIRAMKAIGHSLTEQGVEKYVDYKVPSMRTDYLMTALDGDQYSRETRRIWLMEA
jgi:hypothetical protein